MDVAKQNCDQFTDTEESCTVSTHRGRQWGNPSLYNVFIKNSKGGGSSPKKTKPHPSFPILGLGFFWFFWFFLGYILAISNIFSDDL